MKYREILLDQLKSLPYFEKGALRQLSAPYGLKSSSIDAYILQALKRRDILPLRKGLYVSADFYSTHKNDVSYTFYLANVLRRPSYVSSWTALQYYNLTTEAIRTVTSVTMKTTRNYETKAGSFAYQSIQKKQFTGFSLEKGRFDYFIASPSKALFDLLYFRTRQFTTIGVDAIEAYVDDLRIDLDEMPADERETFHALIERSVQV